MPAAHSSSGRNSTGASAQGSCTQDHNLRRDEASRARCPSQNWYAVRIRKGQRIGPCWIEGTKVMKTHCSHYKSWPLFLLSLTVTLTLSVGQLWAQQPG